MLIHGCDHTCAYTFCLAMAVITPACIHHTHPQLCSQLSIPYAHNRSHSCDQQSSWYLQAHLCAPGIIPAPLDPPPCSPQLHTPLPPASHTLLLHIVQLIQAPRPPGAISILLAFTAPSPIDQKGAEKCSANQDKLGPECSAQQHWHSVKLSPQAPRPARLHSTLA